MSGVRGEKHRRRVSGFVPCAFQKQSKRDTMKGGDALFCLQAGLLLFFN